MAAVAVFSLSSLSGSSKSNNSGNNGAQGCSEPTGAATDYIRHKDSNFVFCFDKSITTS